MAKFFKENKKMLLLFLAIAIIFPIMILFPSPVGIIPYEIGLTIVGYGGSILGGFLTLYGVWWTIEDNKKQREEDQKRHDQERKEDLANQYKPYLTLIPANNLMDSNIDIKELGKYDSNEKSFYFELVYQNFGRGEAYNLRYKIFHKNTPIYDSKDQVTIIYNDNILHKIAISISSEKIQLQNDSVFLEVTFIYTDIYSFFMYEQHFFIEFKFKDYICTNYILYINHDKTKITQIYKRGD